MSKYIKLTQYLCSFDAGVWEASFSEVEDVLGFPLPASAREYAAWWANQGRSQSLAWQGAGWQTNSVDLANERITFLYSGDRDEGEGATSVARLTLSDAKAGLAANFGVPVENIDITIRA